MVQKSDWKTLEMPPQTASFALSQTGSLAVTANRDPAQHKETVVEADRNMVELLLNRLTGRNGRSAALMQAYLSRKSRPQP